MDKLISNIMKPVSRSEWFELNKPIGEPNVKWLESDPYFIERLQEANGNIIWFGQAVNWKKEEGKEWEVLTTGGVFVPCEMPIYEKLYKELNLT